MTNPAPLPYEAQQQNAKAKKKQAWAVRSFIVAAFAMMYMYVITFFGDTIAPALVGAEHAHIFLTSANWVVGTVLCAAFVSALWFGVTSIYDEVYVTQEQHGNTPESDSE